MKAAQNFAISFLSVSSVVSGICFVPQVIYPLSSSRSFFVTGFAITNTALTAG